MTEIFNRKKDKLKRLLLRKDQTIPEEILWQHLRNKKMRGIKFKRQFSVGIFVLDFYAPSIQLVIEVDGPIHLRKENQEYDEDREKGLKALGLKIIRFSNHDVENNIHEVLKKISERVDTLMK